VQRSGGLLDFGLDRVDKLLAARNGLDVSLKAVGDLLDFREPRFDGRDFFSPNATCARRPSSCLNIPSRGRAVLGGLNLADGVALSALTRSSSVSRCL